MSTNRWGQDQGKTPATGTYKDAPTACHSWSRSKHCECSLAHPVDLSLAPIYDEEGKRSTPELVPQITIERGGGGGGPSFEDVVHTVLRTEYIVQGRGALAAPGHSGTSSVKAELSRAFSTQTSQDQTSTNLFLHISPATASIEHRPHRQYALFRVSSFRTFACCPSHRLTCCIGQLSDIELTCLLGPHHRADRPSPHLPALLDATPFRLGPSLTRPSREEVRLSQFRFQWLRPAADS